jgi:hypothetical protein
MIPDFHIPSRHVCELATYEHFLCTRRIINNIHCKFIFLTSMKSTLEGAKLSRLKLCLANVPEEMVSRYDG